MLAVQSQRSNLGAERPNGTRWTDVICILIRYRKVQRTVQTGLLNVAVISTVFLEEQLWYYQTDLLCAE